MRKLRPGRMEHYTANQQTAPKYILHPQNTSRCRITPPTSLPPPLPPPPPTLHLLPRINPVNQLLLFMQKDLIVLHFTGVRVAVATK